MLVVPVALVFAFGRFVSDPRQARALLVTMGMFFVVGLAVLYWAEGAGNPLLTSLGKKIEVREMKFVMLSIIVTPLFILGFSMASVHDGPFHVRRAIRSRQLMALAGSLAAKPRVAASPGTFPTDGVLFISLLIGVILVVGLLSYFPGAGAWPDRRALSNAQRQDVLTSSQDAMCLGGAPDAGSLTFCGSRPS
jgi:K+-transporting ATPase A subunit